jgi:type III secretion protein T
MMLLLVDVGFALTGKTSQKLNLTTLGQPVKGALTLLMLALMAGIFISQVRDQLVLSDFAAEARALANGK